LYCICFVVHSNRPSTKNSTSFERANLPRVVSSNCINGPCTALTNDDGIFIKAAFFGASNNVREGFVDKTRNSWAGHVDGFGAGGRIDEVSRSSCKPKYIHTTNRIPFLQHTIMSSQASPVSVPQPSQAGLIVGEPRCGKVTRYPMHTSGTPGVLASATGLRQALRV
jgi:hypothetical protein